MVGTGMRPVLRFSWLRTRWTTRPCLSPEPDRPANAAMPSWLLGTRPSPERSWSPSRESTR